MRATRPQRPRSNCPRRRWCRWAPERRPRAQRAEEPAAAPRDTAAPQPRSRPRVPGRGHTAAEKRPSRSQHAAAGGSPRLLPLGRRGRPRRPSPRRAGREDGGAGREEGCRRRPGPSRRLPRPRTRRRQRTPATTATARRPTPNAAGAAAAAAVAAARARTSSTKRRRARPRRPPASRRPETPRPTSAEVPVAAAKRGRQAAAAPAEEAAEAAATGEAGEAEAGEDGAKRRRRGARGGRRTRGKREAAPEGAAEAEVTQPPDAGGEATLETKIGEAPARETKTKGRPRDRRRPKAIVRQDEGSGLGTVVPIELGQRRTDGRRRAARAQDHPRHRRRRGAARGARRGRPPGRDLHRAAGPQVVPGRHLPGQGRERHERHRRRVRRLRPREERLPVRRRGDDAGGREARPAHHRRAQERPAGPGAGHQGPDGPQGRAAEHQDLPGRALPRVRPRRERRRSLPPPQAGRARAAARHLQGAQAQGRRPHRAHHRRGARPRGPQARHALPREALGEAQEEVGDGQGAGAGAQGGRHLARGDARPLQRHLREPDRRRSQAAQGDRLVPGQGGAGAPPQGAPAHRGGAALHRLRRSRSRSPRRSSAASRCRAAATS